MVSVEENTEYTDKTTIMYRTQAVTMKTLMCLAPILDKAIFINKGKCLEQLSELNYIKRSNQALDHDVKIN